MNCTFHSQNVAVVSCNGCGNALCSACDHRIKGFPFCQDCIVAGVDLLRTRLKSGKGRPRRPVPFIAAFLSFICPGLGAAYNSQPSKALIYFAVFAGLFQMAILTGGMPLFVLGFFGMWLFSIVDAWRVARLLRSGANLEGSEDILVQRLSGNPKAWGVILTILGVSFFLQAFLDLGFLLKGLLPVVLVGLGIYLLREYFLGPRKQAGTSVPKVEEFAARPMFTGAGTDPSVRRIDSHGEYLTEVRGKRWKNGS